MPSKSPTKSAPHYAIGDVVFWGTPTTAGEYTFIGHSKDDKDRRILVMAILPPP